MLQNCAKFQHQNLIFFSCKCESVSLITNKLYACQPWGNHIGQSLNGKILKWVCAAPLQLGVKVGGDSCRLLQLPEQNVPLLLLQDPDMKCRSCSVKFIQLNDVWVILGKGYIAEKYVWSTLKIIISVLCLYSIVKSSRQQVHIRKHTIHFKGLAELWWQLYHPSNHTSMTLRLTDNSVNTQWHMLHKIESFSLHQNFDKFVKLCIALF